MRKRILPAPVVATAYARARRWRADGRHGPIGIPCRGSVCGPRREPIGILRCERICSIAIRQKWTPQPAAPQPQAKQHQHRTHDRRSHRFQHGTYLTRSATPCDRLKRPSFIIRSFRRFSMRPARLPKHRIRIRATGSGSRQRFRPPRCGSHRCPTPR